jgi:pimeloyl-ACP methyl ester carboxylesterase
LLGEPQDGWFDKRGTGLSDRIPGAPPVADRIDDIRAVMDEAGSKRATLFGVSEAAAPTGRGSAIP